MSRPGRNLPCPCGSGIKYKKCVDTHSASFNLSEADKAMARSFLGQGRWEVEGSVEARMGQALQAVAALPVEPIRGRTKDVYFYDDANFFGGA